MKKFILYFALILALVFAVSACGDMTANDGYVTSSPASQVTLVPDDRPAVSAAPTATAELPMTSPDAAGNSGAHSTAKPDTESAGK